MNKEYTTGKRSRCGKDSPLKWGKCPDCQGKDDADDTLNRLKDMFGMGNRKGNNSE